ncbi:MAG: hypothetical protein ACRBI6_00900 [Acidimicrobiales bacterium]
MAKPPDCVLSECARWFDEQLPDDWFSEPPAVTADRDEIVVAGQLTVLERDAAGTAEPHVVVQAFREATRERRMAIAEVAQARWQRHVTWEVHYGELHARFTHAAVPVMTRLRFEERAVLDTLIDAGVARSRSEALAWCVDQVGRHQSDWIDRLRDAMTEVERIRREGPA